MEANARGERDDELVLDEARDVVDHRPDNARFYSQEDNLRRTRGFTVIGRDLNAGFTSKGFPQRLRRLGRNDFAWLTKVGAQQPANDGPGELTRPDEADPCRGA